MKMEQDLEEEEDGDDAAFEVYPKKKVQNNEQKKKQVGMRKITSSPAIVRMEKVEKIKYKVGMAQLKTVDAFLDGS